jgi:phosphohistidine phosphatase
MRLLIIRHAIADDREEWAKSGKPDGERPLTAKGMKRMQAAAGGLSRLVETPETIGTSPLVRAAQTAEIVAEVLGDVKVKPVEALSPSADFADLVAWLRSLKTNGTVAVVGHEPHLSGLACYLLTGRRESFLELKKGAACLIQLSEPPTPGVARLLWSLSPGQLRSIAD